MYFVLAGSGNYSPSFSMLLGFGCENWRIDLAVEFGNFSTRKLPVSVPDNDAVLLD